MKPSLPEEQPPAERPVVVGSAEIERRLRMLPIGRAMAATIGSAVGLLAVVTVGGFALLGWPGVAQPDRLTVSNLFDLLKLVFAVLGGAGAVVALVMAYRRQRVAEAANELAERVAADARHDAAERRITELYTKAADQLGSAKAPVRLAGLYALERLAQGNPAHRQTTVDVICAYLRMPYRPEPVEPIHVKRPLRSGRATPPRTEPSERSRGTREEGEVRLTAERILTKHLLHPQSTAEDPEPTPPDTYWPDIDLDLTGALLIDLNLSNCRAQIARFGGATFTSDAQFSGVTITAGAWFEGATFTGNAWFQEATFCGGAGFQKATFCGLAYFRDVTFYGDARFGESTFAEEALFGEVTFYGVAEFGDATFTSDAEFDGATFTSDDAWLRGGQFTIGARFSQARFYGAAQFARAIVEGMTADRDYWWPPGWTIQVDPRNPDRGLLVPDKANDQLGPSAAEI